jgi:hypothetical protein
MFLIRRPHNNANVSAATGPLVQYKLLLRMKVAVSQPKQNTVGIRLHVSAANHQQAELYWNKSGWTLKLLFKFEISKLHKLNRIWSTLAKMGEWKNYTPRTGWTFQQILPEGRGGDRGSTVIKLLYYKPGGRWFEPSWCHWNFSLT